MQLSQLVHMSVVQHAQMLVVRKEGKAHSQYNSFRSAFELLEVVGREPQDNFEEMEEDMSPLERLEQRMQQKMFEMKVEMETKNKTLQSENETLKQEISDIKTRLNRLENDGGLDTISSLT